MQSDQLNTLVVEGAATLCAEPDLAKLTIDLAAESNDYANTMVLVAERAKELREGLMAKFVDVRKMRTEDFSVRQVAEDGSHEGSCRMYLEGALRQSWLDLVMDALAEVAPEAVVNLEFGLQDPDALQQRVLVKAVADARRNADALARAADVRLGKIVNVLYREGSDKVAHISSLRLNIPLDADVEIGDFGSVPAEYSDRVRVVWSLND